MLYNSNKQQEIIQSEKNRKIQEIYKDEMNNECFDCGKPNPDFISANNGVFICKNCMSIHYQFSDEVSLIIKNNLFLLNEEQINYIYFGGNRKLLEFINYKYPKLQEYEPEILYKTQAMQYYRDNLYYLAEGGNEPIKPTENCAYNLMPNVENYILPGKDDNMINNSNNNQHNYINQNENYEDDENELDDNDLNDEEEGYINDEYNSDKDIENNYKININRQNRKLNQLNNNNNNYVVKLPYNNSFVYNKRRSNLINDDDENIDEKNFSNFKNTNIDNTSSNKKNNYNRKRDNFFKEMNRLFGGSGQEDEEENLEQEQSRNFNSDMDKIPNYKKSQNNKRNKTYKAKRPHENYNYNNYIKNTININNNNTNIFLDDNIPFNKNILSKSQIVSMNLSHDNLGKNNHNIEPIYKNNRNKNKINISRTVYIKPKLNSYNTYNIKSPMMRGNKNINYSSVPNRINHKIANNYLSPTLYSPINNGNIQNIVFNKRYSNYSLKIKSKKLEEINNFYNYLIIDEKASTPIHLRSHEPNILNIDNDNYKGDVKEKNDNDYTEQMNDYEQFDNWDNNNLNKNINNEKLLKYSKIKFEQEKEKQEQVQMNNNIIEHNEELNNINIDNKEINIIDNNGPMVDNNIDNNLEEKNKEIFDGFQDKQILSQRNITEEIKEEKDEDEESEKNKPENEKKEEEKAGKLAKPNKNPNKPSVRRHCA